MEEFSYTYELGISTGVAERGHQRGHKVGDGSARSRHALREEHEPDAPVADRHDKGAPVRDGRVVGTRDVSLVLDPGHGVVALFLRQPRRVARPVWQNETVGGVCQRSVLKYVPRVCKLTQPPRRRRQSSVPRLGSCQRLLPQRILPTKGSLRKSHFQAGRPFLPPRPDKMAPASERSAGDSVTTHQSVCSPRRPPNAPASCEAE